MYISGRWTPDLSACLTDRLGILPCCLSQRKLQEDEMSLHRRFNTYKRRGVYKGQQDTYFITRPTSSSPTPTTMHLSLLVLAPLLAVDAAASLVPRQPLAGAAYTAAKKECEPACYAINEIDREGRNATDPWAEACTVSPPMSRQSRQALSLCLLADKLIPPDQGIQRDDAMLQLRDQDRAEEAH